MSVSTDWTKTTVNSTNWVVKDASAGDLLLEASDKVLMETSVVIALE